MTSVSESVVVGKIMVMLFALLLFIPATAAFGAHQLKKERRGVFNLAPTVRAGGAAGMIDFTSITKNYDPEQDFDDNKENDDETRVRGTVEVTGLSNVSRVHAFLVDNEGLRSVYLGKLEDVDGRLKQRFSVEVHDLQRFDRAVVSRERERDRYKNPGTKVLFEVKLPHK